MRKSELAEEAVLGGEMEEISSTGSVSIAPDVIETAKIKVLNPVTDRYEEKELPKEAASVIVQSQMQEGWERQGATRMSTDRYDPRMRRCFVNSDRSDPATIRAWELGYRPVVDKAASRDHGHTVGKVTNWEGDITFTGDAVLMEVPEAVASTREAMAIEIRERQKQSQLSDARNHMESILGEATRDGGSRVLDSYRGQDMGYDKTTHAIGGEAMTADASDRSRAGAASLERAQAYSEGLLGGKSSSTFGGFQGKPGFNPLPESPVMRRILEKQVG